MSGGEFCWLYDETCLDMAQTAGEIELPLGHFEDWMTDGKEKK